MQNREIKILADEENRTVKKIYYNYKGKRKRFRLIETDEQIATVCQAEELENVIDIEVVSPGMGYEEICENFPAKRGKKDYCMVDLFTAVIWEEYQRVMNGKVREPGNVRNFWYTHIKYLVEDVLGLSESDSVKTTLNDSWARLIDSGMITYEEMNIYSDKETSRKSFVSDSPFSNLIVAAEKEDLYSEYEWIPELFNCTLVTAGGQPSRAVSRRFVKELRDNGVNLDQDMYMCTISDLDPAGYYIQENFKDQLEKAIEYYGGSADIEIKRLFVRKDQVTDKLLEYQAMPCIDKGAKTKRAKKSEDTKWEHFCKLTDGGLYKDRNGSEVRAKLELNAFTKEVIEDSIIEEVLKIIHKTNDESKIMIPEIMRVFEELKDDVRNRVFENHKDDWLQPIIDEHLEKADNLKSDLSYQSHRERKEEENRFEEEKQPIEDEYQELIDEEREEVEEVEEEEREEIDEYREEQGYNERLYEIEEEIRTLREEREEIKTDVKETREENFNRIDEAWEEFEEERDELVEDMEEEIEPLEEEHEEKLEEIQAKKDYRLEKVEEFKRWKETEFNPIKMSLKEHITDAMYDLDGLDKKYRDIEKDDRTQTHIAKLMTSPKQLLDEDVSAWEQKNYPVFEEEDLLRKASKEKDRTVEPHRRGLSEDFVGGMKSIIWDEIEEMDFTYPEIPELKDIEEEIEELRREIKEEIKEGEYREDEGEEGKKKD